MATTEPQKWVATLGSTADVNTIPETRVPAARRSAGCFRRLPSYRLTREASLLSAAILTRCSNT